MEVTVDQGLRLLAAMLVDDRQRLVHDRGRQPMVEFGRVLVQLLGPRAGLLGHARQSGRRRDRQLTEQIPGNRRGVDSVGGDEHLTHVLGECAGVRTLEQHRVPGVVAPVQLHRATPVPGLESIRLVHVAGMREGHLEHCVSTHRHHHADLAVQYVAVALELPAVQQVLDDPGQLVEPRLPSSAFALDGDLGERLRDHPQRSDFAERETRLKSMSLGVISPATTLVTCSAIGISTSCRCASSLIEAQDFTPSAT